MARRAGEAAELRDAYPRSGERLTPEEFKRRYRLSDADLVFISSRARGTSGCLTLAALLKAGHDLGFFPALDNIYHLFGSAIGFG